MTTAEAARALELHPSRIRALIDEGKLQATKLGRDWYIEPAALKAVRVRKPGRPRKEKA